MRIALGSDHAGFELKREMMDFVRSLGHETIDVGAFEYDAGDDYPDFAAALGEAVHRGKADRGVLICGSGVGASVAANKIRGVRAGLCHDCYSAHQGVEHDEMNVLVMGSRVIGTELARDIVKQFLTAQFTGAERHVRRLAKVQELERKFMES
ncbi:MAG TPA: ribose 5-phosphate isomerase B [Bryobacteraceae bacterium]|nr:ribose 5-phosphate isomerase B [Bryobacteraceae bacterium]